MYSRYFGLKSAPFSLAPDPRYLYMSPQHEEALAHLLYGIGSDSGFVLLTGEIGAGKTTLCRHVLEKLSSDIAFAFIINPMLSELELLAAVCDDFGISYPRQTSIKELIDLINAFLLELNAAGKKAILIIEEAQNLRSEVLEQIRLLTNLETNERKLLQIILIGQPELRDKLALPEMRQLSQRIVARYHIHALSKPEVIRYINHRIAVARGLAPGSPRAAGDTPPVQGRPSPARKLSILQMTGSRQPPRGPAGPGPDSERCALFSKAALNSLYVRSEGIPRLINLICDRALLGAFVQDTPIVDRATIEKAAVEVLGAPLPTEAKRKHWRTQFAAAVLAGAFLTLLYVFFHGVAPPGISLAGKAWRLWQTEILHRNTPARPQGRRMESRPSLAASPGSFKDTGGNRVPEAKPPSQPRS
jgi:general secretion pathway protein A